MSMVGDLYVVTINRAAIVTITDGTIASRRAAV
jgi:hypothetical protein